MSGVSDKARFYLEQAVPQLQEFEQKKIFDKASLLDSRAARTTNKSLQEEIKTLVKKRSDFEHKVLARGNTPVDYARYAAWEISLEKLRVQRCRRLKIKTSSAHAGQARIFLIFDRATRRHPGDLDLWMSYLEFAKDVKAVKKFKTIMTKALRLHPTKPELWLYAARWTLEYEKDMAGARGYMQRGMRFCTRSGVVWVEYARLEMIYLAKIAIRRRILGIDKDPSQPRTTESEDKNGFEEGADMISLAAGGGDESFKSSMVEGVKVDSEAVKDPMQTPALNGAIPMAIFDDARKQPFWTPAVGEDFYEMFSNFTVVPSLPKILQHVVDTMNEAYANDASTCSINVRQSLVGIVPTSAEFPLALSTSLERLKESKEKVKDRAELAKRIRRWMEPLSEVKGLDEAVVTVLSHTLRKLD